MGHHILVDSILSSQVGISLWGNQSNTAQAAVSLRGQRAAALGSWEVERDTETEVEGEQGREAQACQAACLPGN